jgi:hypothetical protein
MALAVAALVPFGIFDGSPVPAAVTHRPWLLLASGLALLALFLVGGAGERERRLGARAGAAAWRDAALAFAVAAAAVLARRALPTWLGLAGLLALPAAALLALLRRRPTLALGFAFASYALVSRDAELWAVAGAAALVEAAALGFARSLPPGAASADRPYATATLGALLFAAAFLARVGVQQGLDFDTLDFKAGSFGGPGASELLTGLCMGWKFVAVDLLLLGATLAPLGAALRRRVAGLLAVAAAARTGMLACMIFACSSSYWSSLRALSDFPGAALLAVAASLVLLAPGVARLERVSA